MAKWTNGGERVSGDISVNLSAEAKSLLSIGVHFISARGAWNFPGLPFLEALAP